MLNFLLIFVFITNSFASPFDLAEDYINEFKIGIENLKNLSETYQFIEENYNSIIYNETEALTETETYDFIIVGGGTSGSVIANRLSEIPEWRILLLEAGNDENDYTKIPKLNKLLLNTPFNWNFQTTPQKTWCLSSNKCQINAGKLLGGSSSINNMLYTRGNQNDYNLWADLSNDGWCYKDILPYYKKAENSHLTKFDRKYHNQGGLFHIEHPQYQTDFTNNLQKHLIDYNGEIQLGLGLVQLNTKNGKRQSTNEAYLKPIKTRSNLKIQTNSLVTKILIGHHTKEATSVKYVHNSKLFIAKADKEIIVTAGAINTPKLLQLSGIGPKDILKKAGITQIADLPTGKHLKDHLIYYGLKFITNQTENHTQDPVYDYLKNGKGPLTSAETEIVGYYKTEKTQTRPAIQLLWKPLKDKLHIGVMLTHSKSTGTIAIKDSDPYHQPIIDPNQLTDPENYDLETLLKGIQIALNFTQNYILADEKIEACQEYEHQSNDYWKCSIRHLTASTGDISGTCKMGPETDNTSVVNNNLQVYNIKKLRICDTSVIPVTITGHLMAPAILIGEKASDLIKNDWK